VDKLFVDTNIILDWLLDREPYADAATRLFSLADRGELTLMTSALSMVNVAYFLRKAIGDKHARSTLAKLRIRCEVTPSGNRQIDEAISDGGPDFEDAYQYACATAAGADMIVTRDARGYKHSALPVLTAAEYLANYTAR
jgi:predicted nucleic acid-binding protein